ncbi:MAG: hypothetical protein J07HX64_01430 [halophilic archaeon J07HX64]|jgi:hypothetical protein|nr:MAG: hypothetical protein J07HX64_01430 [halophilic archaeon J07HX64]
MTEFELDSRRVPPSLTVVLSYDKDGQQVTLSTVVANRSTRIHYPSSSSSTDNSAFARGITTLFHRMTLTVEGVGQRAVVRLQFRGRRYLRAGI